uniref:Uncharacterized protein n=1 Tax=Globodera pallida TaxID=36090 RepID=A0A183C1A8_GLOPA
MQQIFRDKFENVLKKKADDLKRIRTKIEGAFIVKAGVVHVSGDPPIEESIANEQQQRHDDTFAATQHVSMDSLIDEANSPIDESIANEQQQPQDDPFVEVAIEHVSGDAPIDESIANEQIQRLDDTFVVEVAIEHVSGDAPINESIANEQQQRQDDPFVEAATEQSGDAPIDESIANEQQQPQDDTFVVEAAIEHVSGDAPIDESIVNDQRQDDTFVGEAATERDSFANEQRQDDTVVAEPATEHVSVDSLIDETNPPIDEEIGREQNATYILETATTCAHNLTKKRSPISTDTDYGLDDFTSGDDTG